jgi:hypothetical protein
MQTLTRRTLAATGLTLVLTASAYPQMAPQQSQQQTVRVRGEIEKVDGSVLTVKSRDGSSLTVKLADNARIAGIVKASIADVKQGSYIGISAMPQPDGSQRAIHVHIFPEAMRGTSEGVQPWDNRPGSSMINATTDTTVSGVDGQVLSVKYKDGEKKVIVPPDAPIVTYVPGSKDDLKPGAKIFIIRANKQPDGTLEAPSVNVGKDGLTPPM